MELEFNITEAFNNDLKDLPEVQQQKIKEEINLVSDSLLNGKTSFIEKASIPYIFNLKGSLDSSLYVVKVNNEKKMIAAVDDDHVFNKVSLTMFRLVNNQDAERTYKETGEELYKGQGIL